LTTTKNYNKQTHPSTSTTTTTNYSQKTITPKYINYIQIHLLPVLQPSTLTTTPNYHKQIHQSTSTTTTRNYSQLHLLPPLQTTANYINYHHYKLQPSTSTTTTMNSSQQKFTAKYINYHHYKLQTTNIYRQVHQLLPVRYELQQQLHPSIQVHQQPVTGYSTNYI
jgi:hypothetical protein